MKSKILVNIGFLLICHVTLGQIDGMSGLKVPKLNEHIFSRSEKPTFIGTYVGNNLGVGIHNDYQLDINVPGIDTTYEVSGKLVFATLNIEYQQRVKEWMAFNSEFGLNARVGVDGISLLTEGFRQVNFINLGWLIRFFHNEHIYISSYFFFQRLNGNYIDISEFVDEVFDPNEQADFSKSISNTSASAALNFVWAPSDLFAIVSNNGIGYGDHIFDRRDVLLYNVHLAADLNFISRWNFPLGVYVGYERNNQAELLQTPAQNTDILSYKLNYTGSNDFNFTLEANNTFSPFEDADGRIVFTNIIFSIRVYFQ